MAENNFSLTLDPGAAEKAVEAPSLSLGAAAVMEAPAEEKKEVEPVVIDDSMLNEKEKEEVNKFSETIDITNTNQILTYGSDAQKNIAAFSESTLNSVRTKDLGTVGETLSALVVQLKNVQEPEKKGLAAVFQKKKVELEAMKANFSKAEANVDKIVEILEQHQVTLMKDVAKFDEMYALNLQYYKQLTMYIIAGKKALAKARAGKLEELRTKAEASESPEDAQEYNDYVNLCNRFEKRLHDLELTRMISIQMGPQTRLLQNNDTQMIDKIQTSITNTIPLWKSQMVLALGIEHGKQATAAQSAVTEMTNELLKKNADALKMATIETAREAEKSIVDIETLKHTNEQLISTLDEVMQIQHEGAAKRKEAEVELGRIEGELKQKLLELKSNN